MNKKIVILALHLGTGGAQLSFMGLPCPNLGTGGAEKVICNLANLLSEHNNVKIISTYKLNDTPSFCLNEKLEIEYLIEKKL